MEEFPAFISSTVTDNYCKEYVKLAITHGESGDYVVV